MYSESLGSKCSSLATEAFIWEENAIRIFPQTKILPKKKSYINQVKFHVLLIISLIFLYSTLTGKLFLVILSHWFTSPLHWNDLSGSFYLEIHNSPKLSSLNLPCPHQENISAYLPFSYCPITFISQHTLVAQCVKPCSIVMLNSNNNNNKNLLETQYFKS